MTTLADYRTRVLPAQKSGEHWAGRLYARRVSTLLTWRMRGLPVHQHAVTGLMNVAGLGAAVALADPTVGSGVAAVALGQLYLLGDCADGEIARWRGQQSDFGRRLDQLSHLLVEPSVMGVFTVTWLDRVLGTGGVDGLRTSVVIGLLAGVARAVSLLIPPVQSRGRLRWPALISGNLIHTVEVTILSLGALLLDAAIGSETVGGSLVLAVVVGGLLASLITKLLDGRDERVPA